jgi:hypothetical protein
MEIYPAVIVHGLSEAREALARARAAGTGVTLVSAHGAALHAGCGWWRALVDQARAAEPEARCLDILDCADGTGQAMAALRIGLCRLVLWPEAPGRDAVVAIARQQGGFVLPAAPQVDPTATGGRESQRRQRAAANGDKTRPPG